MSIRQTQARDHIETSRLHTRAAICRKARTDAAP